MKKLALFTALSLLSGLQTSSAQSAKVTLGLGYIPNIQFAPFYVALEQGSFKAEGFDVALEHGYASQLLPLLLAGRIDYLVGDAEDAVFARAQNQPLRYVLAMYQSLPVTLFSLSEKKISKLSDLKGKTIGIPGPFGSSYYALQSALSKNKLTDQDVTLQTVGYAQLEAVRGGKVDAALGFINNEPLTLKKSGVAVNTLSLSSFYPMVGNGVITTDKTLSNAASAKKFLRAIQKGIAFTVKNPQKAFEDSKKYVDKLDAGQLEVLNASIPLMKSAYTAKNGLGFSDTGNWSRALSYLKNSGQLKSSLPSSAFYSNAYLQKGIQ